MVLRIQRNAENRIFKVYLLAMFAMVAVRYLLKANVPAVAFLAVAMLPIWWGTPSEQMAFVASCIPLSIAFQYKYALLILSVAILVKNHGRLKWSGVLPLVFAMMVWELWHAVYGHFSYVEYLRDFAELLILGVVTSINLKDVDHKLVIRSLVVSVVGICAIMLFMQLQQFNFDIVAVFIRSAKSFRFGQSNMEEGAYALNFNANNLGFICNLATCGSLLLTIRKEHTRTDIVLMIGTVIFGLMTLSRAAIVCLLILFAGYLFFAKGDLVKKVFGGIGTILIAFIALILIQLLVPSVFVNIAERFQRDDVWNGRGGLLKYYHAFLLSSPKYLLFGAGMQSIFEKVSPYFPVLDVPHMGLQEVWVAWGLVGLALFLYMLWRLIVVSKQYAQDKRQVYQFMPLALTLIFTMSGQFLTSSRALMALTISYICLCVKKSDTGKEEKLEDDYEQRNTEEVDQ